MAGTNETASSGEQGPDKSLLTKEDIIGLPPSAYFESQDEASSSDDVISTLAPNMIMSSMLMMAIHPKVPDLSKKDDKTGLQLYSLEAGGGAYAEELKTVGVTHDENSPLYVAFLNDTSITESFSNDFGESKFEAINTMASDTLGELKYITGTGTGRVKDITDSAQSFMRDSGALGKLFGGMAGIAGTAGQELQDFMNTRAAGLGNVMLGDKADFPMIWKNSSYSPSYSMTIRLHNPYPTNNQAHLKFIIEPLAKLMVLSLPRSSSASTFTFPFACSVVCPGLFRLKSGFISSLEVIKGGDGQDIAFTQRPATMDIRITFTDLYNSMIIGDSSDDRRPTLGDYIEDLKTDTKIANLAGYSGLTSEDFAETTEEVPTTNDSAESLDSNYVAEADDRVSDAKEVTAATLAAAEESPDDYPELF
ncbi:MAG: hypothetical protein KAS32_02320 [Candidatus Peribacteraceae bacterium]|nr:hypothetical protein [Candidatus Peribacteraceae bacterium]